MTFFYLITGERPFGDFCVWLAEGCPVFRLIRGGSLGQPESGTRRGQV